MIAPTIDDPAYFARLALVEPGHWWSVGLWRIAAGWLDRHLRRRTGLAALDVGCGAGGTLQRLSDRPEFARVCGIDPSPSALAHASGFEVAIGSALALPFAPESFDLVTCFDVLQHLAPRGDARAMAEIGRVLRPGGLALVRTNAAGLWPDPAADSQPYRLPGLRTLAADADLVVERLTHANALPSIATECLGRVGGRRAARHHGHPQGRGLRIRPAGRIHNHLMGAIAGVEAFAITRLNLDLPAGHSAMMLARKPGGTMP